VSRAASPVAALSDVPSAPKRSASGSVGGRPQHVWQGVAISQQYFRFATKGLFALRSAIAPILPPTIAGCCDGNRRRPRFGTTAVDRPCETRAMHNAYTRIVPKHVANNPPNNLCQVAVPKGLSSPCGKTTAETRKRQANLAWASQMLLSGPTPCPPFDHQNYRQSYGAALVYLNTSVDSSAAIGRRDFATQWLNSTHCTNKNAAQLNKAGLFHRRAQARCNCTRDPASSGATLC